MGKDKKDKHDKKEKKARAAPMPTYEELLASMDPLERFWISM